MDPYLEIKKTLASNPFNLQDGLGATSSIIT